MVKCSLKKRRDCPIKDLDGFSKDGRVRKDARE